MKAESTLQAHTEVILQAYWSHMIPSGPIPSPEQLETIVQDIFAENMRNFAQAKILPTNWVFVYVFSFIGVPVIQLTPVFRARNTPQHSHYTLRLFRQQSGEAAVFTSHYYETQPSELFSTASRADFAHYVHYNAIPIATLNVTLPPYFYA